MAAITPYMGLKVWNLLNDSFDHVQLAENLAKIDQHDHSEGKGNLISTGGIADGAISTAKLGLDAVTDEKILKAPVRGQVTSEGGIGFGSGFTAAKTGTGLYTVTFSPALSTKPIVATAGASTGAIVVVTGVTTGVANFGVTINNVASNSAFYFIAYPS